MHPRYSRSLFYLKWQLNKTLLAGPHLLDQSLFYLKWQLNKTSQVDNERDRFVFILLKMATE